MLNQKIMVLVTLLSVAAEAKVLTAQCQDQFQEHQIHLSTSMTNVMEPQHVDELRVDGEIVSSVTDQSARPLLKDGVFHLQYALGSSQRSTLSLELRGCDDSFMASGSGTLSLYVGGFAGSRKTSLTCRCELQ